MGVRRVAREGSGDGNRRSDVKVVPPFSLQSFGVWRQKVRWLTV